MTSSHDPPPNPPNPPDSSPDFDLFARRVQRSSRGQSWGWVLIGLGLVLAVVAVVVALRPGTAPVVTPTAAETQTWSPIGADPLAYADALVVDTNTARAADGLPALSQSECARAAAVDRAQALTGGRALTHASLVPVMQACDPAGPAAENLSRAAADPQAVVNA